MKTWLWKIILYITGSIAFIYGFLIFGPFGPLGIFLIIIYLSSFKGSSDTTSIFLRLQQDLPTSRIRSMAMGLVEVEGTLRTMSPVLAPLNSKPCVGYRYTVESISKDRDGKDSFSMMKDETVCANFYITDQTGETEVICKDLKWLWVAIDTRKQQDKERHTQYLLLEGENMLLIGMASTENQKTVICKEPIKEVFMIAPSAAITKWEKYRPLLKSFTATLIVIAFISSLVLFADVSVSDSTLHINLKSLKFDWGNLF